MNIYFRKHQIYLKQIIALYDILFKIQRSHYRPSHAGRCQIIHNTTLYFSVMTIELFPQQRKQNSCGTVLRCTLTGDTTLYGLSFHFMLVPRASFLRCFGVNVFDGQLKKSMLGLSEFCRELVFVVLKCEAMKRGG